MRTVTKIFVLSLFSSCSDVPPTELLSDLLFENQTEVQILGYNDHAMEPFISRDGQLLFFNNLNDPSVNTNLHYATRVEDDIFQYEGELDGVNTASLEGVATMDRDGNFYFTTLRSYTRDLLSLYGGSFLDGEVKDIEPIGQNLTRDQLGYINFDAEVSSDGQTLYFAIGKFTGNPFPAESNLWIAKRENGVFVLDDRSEEILQNVNTDLLEYAAGISSDELELFFTRADIDANPPVLKVMVASRPNADAIFDLPAEIATITGQQTEAPSITSDGKTLYFHKNVNGVFRIFKVER